MRLRRILKHMVLSPVQRLGWRGYYWSGYTDYTHKSLWITADWINDTARQVGFEIASLRRYYVWNDNKFDDVWRVFTNLIQTYPANIILEDQFGDGIEVILRRLREPLTHEYPGPKTGPTAAHNENEVEPVPVLGYTIPDTTETV